MKATLVGIMLSMFVFSAAAIPHSLPILVSYNELSKESQRQVTCLAENIYFEAASESLVGKVAVAFVTINRVLSGIFPNTICGVVQQKINGVCQFSWYCDDRALNKRNFIKRTALYNDILKLSVEILTYHKVLEDITYGAMYFHNTTVNPKWRLYKTAQIGNHVFYSHSRRQEYYAKTIHIN